LKAGVLENGVVTVSEKGTGQGSVISPLLANVRGKQSASLGLKIMV
jgi:retron-type reverse transcriptase